MKNQRLTKGLDRWNYNGKPDWITGGMLLLLVLSGASYIALSLL